MDGRRQRLRLISYGVGDDGACATGVDLNDVAIVVHRLAGSVLTDSGRRRRLGRRLEFQQRCGHGPGVEPIHRLDLESEHPTIVVRSTLRTLASAPPGAAFLEPLLGLVRGLAAAHAEGIVHGRLAPTHICVDDDGAWRASYLDLQTGAFRAPRAPWPLPTAPQVSDDAFALGALIVERVLGEAGLAAFVAGTPAETLPWPPGVDGELVLLAADLGASEPADRPFVSDVVPVLERIVRRRADAVTMPREASSSVATVVEREEGSDPAAARRRVGRFSLVEPLGAGAMGQVWRAIDDDSGAVVAVKLIGRDLALSTRALRRFRKEARLLGELQHPGIARAIDAGEADDGTLYLATELVAGRSLATVVRERGPLPEAEVVAIAIDLVRALVDVHDNGIVHRDIKPDNIMLVGDDAAPSRVKLIDFGVARHVDEAGSLAMTRQGAILGSPLYMAPEQARGEPVDARSDLYAVGSTLFELLLGKAPFAGHGVTRVLAMQTETPAPKVRDLRSDVSFAVGEIVGRLLEKAPADRYPDARALLRDLTALQAKPTVGSSAPASTTSTRYVVALDLQATPARLWPHVSNTDRLNKAIGLVAAIEDVIIDGDDVKRTGRSRQVGFPIAWEEHPFEWVFEQRLGVLRDYSEGPLRWMRSTVELTPTSTGTRLIHTIELEPRGVIGRIGAGVEIGMRMRAALERTYARIDALVSGRSAAGGGGDPFEGPPRLAIDVESRFSVLERQAVKSGAQPVVIEALGSFLREAPAQDIARIRPLALARRLRLDEDAVVEGCLHAAAVGLLVPLWDILCPSCRVPSSMEASLRALREHGRCDVCNLAFALDLAASIELVFRVHPSLRAADTATYCISSPAHTPHVLVQLRLEPGEVRTVEPALPPGLYRLTCRPQASQTALRIREGAPTTTAAFALSSLAAPAGGGPWLLPTGRQPLTLTNDSDRNQLVRVERSTPRDDVLTAARMLSSSLFRRLLPDQVLAEGTLMRVSAVTLLVVVPRVDRPSLEDLYGFYRAVDEVIAGHGGTVVRLHGDGVLASFHDPVSAVRTAMSLSTKLPLPVAAAIHRAPAGAVSLNERLDYFGRGVQELLRIVERATAGELLISAAVGRDVEGLVDMPGAEIDDLADLDDDTVQMRMPVSAPSTASGRA
jgi:eukaryotic-like serine/threonine-protein kinase